MTVLMDDIVEKLGVAKYYRINTPVEYCFIASDANDESCSYYQREYELLLDDINSKIDEINVDVIKNNNDVGKYLLLLNKKIQFIMHSTSKFHSKCDFAFVNISSKGGIFEISKEVSVGEVLKLYLFFTNSFDLMTLNAKVNSIVNLENKIYVSVDFFNITETEEDRIIKNIFESKRRFLQSEKIEKA